MGEFKPMVKMETTEPSVELKLKKGGSVAHKPMKGKADSQKTVKKAMGGGLGAMSPAMAIQSAPMETMPTRAPKRPSLADRRKAMMMAQMGRKKGGPAEGTKAEEKAESKAEQKKEMKAGHGKNYKTGGVVKGNGGGYKTGGATKKFADGGSAVKMPQGSKKASPPVAINMLSGAYKKGGKVKKMADGGSYDESFASPREQLAEMRRMKNIEKGEGSISDGEREMANGLGLADKIGNFYNKAKAMIKGPSVTDSKTTVSRTVSPPAKKRGGRC